MARRTSIALASACGAFALLVYVVALHTGIGRSADLAAFTGFRELSGTAASTIANSYVHLCNAGPFAILSLTLIACAGMIHGRRAAVVVGAILMLPNVLTQELKPLLSQPRVGAPGIPEIDAASWPSGHSTAAMALALCAVIAAPAALRWVVAVAGALFAVAIGYALVLLGWHFPSDVLGGFAVAGMGGALGIAALHSAPASRGLSAAVPLTALLVAGGAALLVGTAAQIDAARDQAAFLAFGAGIGVLALVLAAGAAGAFSPRAATAALRSRSRRATG